MTDLTAKLNAVVRALEAIADAPETTDVRTLQRQLRQGLSLLPSAPQPERAALPGPTVPVGRRDEPLPEAPDPSSGAREADTPAFADLLPRRQPSETVLEVGMADVACPFSTISGLAFTEDGRLVGVQTITLCILPPPTSTLCWFP